jgi:hypothetical protein
MSTHTSTHDLPWFSDPGTPWGGEEPRVEQPEYDADTDPGFALPEYEEEVARG